jgi:hypothetical protein
MPAEVDYSQPVQPVYSAPDGSMNEEYAYQKQIEMANQFANVQPVYSTKPVAPPHNDFDLGNDMGGYGTQKQDVIHDFNFDQPKTETINLPAPNQPKNIPNDLMDIFGGLA